MNYVNRTTKLINSSRLKAHISINNKLKNHTGIEDGLFTTTMSSVSEMISIVSAVTGGSCLLRKNSGMKTTKASKLKIRTMTP